MTKLLITIFITMSIYANEHITIYLKWKHQFEFAGFYAAIEKGYYSDIGLDVKLVEFHENNIVSDVLSTPNSYGFHDSTIILDKMRGKSVKILASYFKKSPLVIITQSDIVVPTELSNKTIMAGKHELDSNALGTMLKNFKVTNYRVVPHTYHIDDFINKRVDAMTAFISNEVYYLKKNSVKFNILNPSNYGIDVYGGILFTTNNEIDKHANRVQQITNATNRGWEYALEHKDEIIKLIINKYSDKKSYDALMYEANTLENIIMPKVYKVGYINQKMIDQSAKIFIQTGMFEGSYDIQDIIYSHEKALYNVILVFIGLVLILIIFLIIYLKKNKELKALNQSINTLFDVTLQTVVIYDKSGKIKYANDFAYGLLGYKEEDFIGKKIYNFVIDADKQEAERNLRLNSNSDIHIVTVINANGTHLHCQAKGGPILYNGIEARVSVLVDISELIQLNNNLEKKVQLELNKNREKEQIMLQQSKLASMGEMIGNIAHQWRQPLNTLALNTQMLEVDFEDKTIDSNYIQHYVKNNMLTIDFMSNTIDDFRNFFKKDKEKTTFELLPVIEEVLNIINQAFEKHGIKINTNIEKCIFNGYKNELMQVILNILNNARDALIHSNTQHPTIDITVKCNTTKSLAINIEDNAGGISKDIIDKIFEPYFTTKFQKSGTGIGLYMSKIIIETNMDGRLIGTNHNNGALFSILLTQN